MQRTASALSRRDLLKLSTCGAFGASMSRWMLAFANEAIKSPGRKKSVILLWILGKVRK